MCEIIWNKNINEENKIDIEKHLNPFLWLVPKWCQNLHVQLFSSDDNSDCLRTVAEYDYRRITIEFYTNWLNTWKQTKGAGVVHELIHGFTGVVYNLARKKIEIACGDNEQLKESFLEDLRVADEAQTQDLAFAIYNKFKDARTAAEN